MNLVETGKRVMVGTGAQAVLWLLVALSVVSIAMILERAVAFARRRGDVAKLRRDLRDALDQGGFARARAALEGSKHPAALVALRGLRIGPDGMLPTPKEAESAMDAEMIAQKSELEAGLGVLATLGNNAPFVGLFGTVVGIVGAFDALGHSAMNASGGAGQVMSAIGEALVATAVGIGVAIPAVASFNFFTKRAKASLAGAEILQKEILAYLEAREPNVTVNVASSSSVALAQRSGAHPIRSNRQEGYAHGV